MKSGKVRFVGLSNESAWGAMKFLAVSEARGLPRMQSIQNAYHLLNRTYETALSEVTMREGISLLPYSPLAQGYLTGKYLDGARPAEAAAPCSTAASAMRSRGRKRRSANTSPSPRGSGSTPPSLPMPS